MLEEDHLKKQYKKEGIARTPLEAFLLPLLDTPLAVYEQIAMVGLYVAIAVLRQDVMLLLHQKEFP